jgi:hypothetical protein
VARAELVSASSVSICTASRRTSLLGGKLGAATTVGVVEDDGQVIEVVEVPPPTGFDWVVALAWLGHFERGIRSDSPIHAEAAMPLGVRRACRTARSPAKRRTTLSAETRPGGR